MESERGLHVTEIYGFEQHTRQQLPLFIARIPAGYPSPGDDYIDKKLDLNEYLVKPPATTFCVKVEGDSMLNAGIHSVDILVVERPLESPDNKVVIAVINGELTVKRIRITGNKLYPIPENHWFNPIEITPEMSFEIWGVVTYVIHPVK